MVETEDNLNYIHDLHHPMEGTSFFTRRSPGRKQAAFFQDIKLQVLSRRLNECG